VRCDRLTTHNTPNATAGAFTERNDMMDKELQHDIICIKADELERMIRAAYSQGYRDAFGEAVSIQEFYAKQVVDKLRLKDGEK